MIKPSIQKNDKKAKALIVTVSAVVFLTVVSLKFIQLDVDLGFDIHIFAAINAFVNASVAMLLLMALIAVKKKNYLAHKKLMLMAMGLSIIFLLSYIAHHILAGETSHPKDAAYHGFYIFILLTHIFLAAIILPFILFTAYRGLIAEYPQHKKLARITWPIWFYVAISGVIVYMMISPYYH
jgi:putative membrane protein